MSDEPATLGRCFCTQHSAGEGGLRQLRYDVPNGAEASVEFSIQPLADGVLHYTYALNDAPRAPQRSKRVPILAASRQRWSSVNRIRRLPICSRKDAIFLAALRAD